jgi:dipeptidase D
MILARRWWCPSLRLSRCPHELLPRPLARSATTNKAAAMSSPLAPYTDPADAARAAGAAKLDPQPVFSLFAELAQIPRPSAKEQRALQWIKSKADALGLEYQQDARGNLVVRRPAGPGCEGAPGVILQGHVDMVTENNADVQHDWANDPVRLRVTQEEKRTWLRAVGTTLGADNGVGLCAAMAVLALPRETPLPPLEALITVEEETGLLGASALDASMLKGTVLLNLDSECWPEITTGCAGAGDTLIEAGGLAVEPLDAASPPPLWLRLTVDGLSGGHSGLQIAEGRGNAVQMLATAARAVRRAVAAAANGGAVSARLGWLDGGDKRNAIAREARCDLVIVGGDVGGKGGGNGAGVAAREAAAAAAERLASCWRDEYGSVEPGLRVTLAEVGEEGGDDKAPPSSSSSPLDLLRRRRAALRDADAERVLTLLSVLPHGPVRFSPAMPGLVETSNNTASIKLAAEEEGAATTTVRALVQVSTRSSFPHAIDEQRDRVALAATAAGATRVLPGEAYAGWAPDPKSRLARLVAQCVAEVEAEDAGLVGPEKADAPAVPIVALHAGLECGVLRERLLQARAAAGATANGHGRGGKAIEIVSFGPTILGAHSPEERVDVETTGKFWRALLKVLAELAKA